MLPDYSNSPLVECVANFSEGQRPEVISAIAGTIAAAGAHVLDQTSDYDHHRSVITFVGRPDVVGEAAVQSVGKALELIDLSTHSGVHPRIGVADVVPFVPLRGISLVECAWLAQAVGAEIWNRFQVPVYLYEAAAQTPERQDLARVRAAVARQPVPLPDFGNAELHPTAGAVAVGARKILIAWNVFLQTSDVEAAKEIARRIRASNGGLACVKALGLYLPRRNQAQVSMNLTDFEVTPPHIVLDAIARHARSLDVEIASSELIGLIPQTALDWAASVGIDLRIEEFDSSRILEERMKLL